MRIARFHIRRTLSIKPIFGKLAIQSSGMLAGWPGEGVPPVKKFRGRQKLEEGWQNDTEWHMNDNQILTNN